MTLFPGRKRHLFATLAAVVAILTTGCDENRTVPTHDDYVAPEAEPLPCFPNLDGQIASNELLTAYGTTVRYLVTPYGVERPIDVAGAVDAEGHLFWDWAADYVDDQIVRIVPETLDGKWYAGSFPAGEIVAPFDAGGSIESILRQDDEGLWLLGLASTEADPPEGRTLLVYGAPVGLIRFPIRPGLQFVSTGEVQQGLVRGLQYAGRDVYEVSVDATGRLELPQLTFTQAHRVRTHVTVEPAVGASASRWQVSYFNECFAEVARAVSLDGEPSADFTTASEVWRMGLP